MNYKEAQQATRDRRKQFTVITPAKEGPNRATRRKRTKPQYSPQEKNRRLQFMRAFQKASHAFKSCFPKWAAMEKLAEWVFAKKTMINGVKK